MYAALTHLLPRLANASAVSSRAANLAYAGRVLGATATRTFANDSDLKQTPLHALHVENGGEGHQDLIVPLQLISNVSLLRSQSRSESLDAELHSSCYIPDDRDEFFVHQAVYVRVEPVD